MHWKILTTIDPALSSEENRLHPVAEAIMKNRGYRTPEEQDIFLAPDYERDVQDPFLFSQMEDVVARVAQAQSSQEIVGVFGDFDADGVTSSVILRKVLESLGIPVEVYLPEKLTEGHGLNNKAVDFFKEKKATLIFTLDCGMMNHAEVLYAKEQGIECIIIDHHHVPEVLPEAFAIINPKLKDETYPFRDLCGAGTTFKVATAIISTLQPKGKDQLKWLLDIVAIGTVADVMPLVGENRTIVKYGLLVLSKTKNLGLRALLEEANIDFEKSGVPDAELIAFQIAPRINAASRMAHARIAHDLLMAATPEEASTLAKELQRLNVARQKQSAATTKEIKEYLEKEKADKYFLFAAEPHYPYGIVGLVAGRISHTYQKPTAILTKGSDTSRGSFRSVPGFSVIQALEQCADLLERYGGHEQAAGMHIQNQHLEAFEERFNALVETWKSTQEQTSEQNVLTIDAEISPVHIGNELWQDLKKLAPFGEGNREPVLGVRGAVIQSFRSLGKDNEHLKLMVQLENKTFDAIAFNIATDTSYLAEGMKVDLACTLGENTWAGTTRLQLRVLDIQ